MSASTRTPRVAWWILVILGLVFALFAVDRAVLSILKTTLATELGLSNQGYSLLVTAFMVPYTAMYLIVGGWIDRVGVKVTLTLCVAVMSLATLATGVAQGLGQLATARFFLGVAEAGVVPAITVAIFTWFASEKRAVAYSLANAVQSLAYVLCPPFVAVVALNLGWRWAFLIPGLVGFIVAGWWWSANAKAGATNLVRADVSNVATPQTISAGMKALIAIPAVRMLILARAICDPFWFFFQYWQTAFLQERVGLSLARIGEITWIPPLVYLGVALILSSYSDRLVAKGGDPAKARLMLILVATLLAPAAFCLPFARTEVTAILLITLTSIMCSTWLNMSSVFMGTLVPRATLGAAIGLMSAVGGVTSIFFNAVVGSMIDRFGYGTLFWIGACLHPAAATLLAWHFLRKPAPLLVPA